MKILHVVPCADEANGVYHVARMLVKKQSADGNEASVVTVRDFSTSTCNLHLVDEVYVHGMWLPREWCACWKVLRAQKSNHYSPPSTSTSRPRLIRMTHGSLSPIYLERQGKWKKRLVAPIERWLFSKTDRVVTTGEWESAWCRQWGLKNDFQVVDLKTFFKVEVRGGISPEGVARAAKQALAVCGERTRRPLHVLYLGQRHPLKGVEFLERAVQEINDEVGSRNEEWRKVDLRIESNIFGEAKEAAWEWCDVLCLPTLSENFGLVVGEALERGKPVIVTDGAPAWEPPTEAAEVEKRGGGGEWWDRLVYLRGFRDGTDAERIRLLKDALKYFIG